MLIFFYYEETKRFRNILLGLVFFSFSFKDCLVCRQPTYLQWKCRQYSKGKYQPMSIFNFLTCLTGWVSASILGTTWLPLEMLSTLMGLVESLSLQSRTKWFAAVEPLADLCSMNRPGSLTPPLSGWDVGPSQGYPQHIGSFP